MTPLRFVHSADLHLDSPFLGLRASAPAGVAEILREATFAAYENIIDLCIRERVDALFVAGDVYDSSDRSLRAQLRFREGLQRLSDAGIRSFICHGNHDPLDGWEAGLDLPPGCHRFGPKVERVPFDPADPARGSVYGVSYPTRDIRHSLVPGFGQVDDEFSIGLLHANVGGDPSHESYSPCSAEELAATGIDYWALGHVHTRRVLRESGPAIVYPGNPQGRHLSETGARGVYLVEAGEFGAPRLEFRAMDTVRWRREELRIDTLRDDQALLDALDALMENAVDESEGRHTVVRIELTGRGDVHEAIQRPGYLGDALAQLNRTWTSQSPFAWCDRIVPLTGPRFDRDAAREAGDFLAELLAIAEVAAVDPDLVAEISEELRALYHHDRAKKYLKAQLPEGEAVRTLVAAAEALCIDQLAGSSR